MFQEDNPSANKESGPKVFWEQNTRIDEPGVPGDRYQEMKMNPNMMINYTLTNYNKGSGSIKTTTVERPWWTYVASPVRPTWGGLPEGHMEALQKQKNYLKQKNDEMTPAYHDDIKVKKVWGNAVYVALGGVMAFVMYILYAL